MTIDAATGLEVQKVASFPWPRVRIAHSGQFELHPPAMACGPRLLIYVHGYNEDVEMAAAYGRGSVTQGLSERGEACAVATFLWHSKFGTFHFGRSVKAANATAPVFAQAVERLQAMCPAMRLHVLAHSLGARVVLKAIAENPIRIRDLALVAPAVDRDALEPGGEFGGVPAKVERILFTHNAADRTMCWYKLRGRRALGERGFKNPANLPSNVLAADMAEAWSHHGTDGGHGAILHPVFWGAFWKKALPADFFQ